MERHSTFMGRKTQYIKMFVLPNLTYILIILINAMSTKIPASYFMEINKLEFTWKGKRSQFANTILYNKTGGLTLPNFRIYNKANNQDSAILTKELTNRSMKENKKPRNRPP